MNEHVALETVMTDLDGLDRAPESSMAWASDWLNRLESVVERYPWPALLVALGVGYLMARRVR
jgi:hypothetical protein